MSKILDRIANLTDEEREAISNLPEDKKHNFLQLVEKCVAAEEENSKNRAESEEMSKNVNAQLTQLTQNFFKLGATFKELEVNMTNLADATQKLAEKDKQILEKTTETMGLCLQMISQNKRIAMKALEICFGKTDDSKLHRA